MIFIYDHNQLKHTVTNNDLKGPLQRDRPVEIDGLLRQMDTVLKHTENDNIHIHLKPLETIGSCV